MDGNPDSIRYVPARDQGGALHHPPLGLVFHDMEAPEKGSTAESVAAYFQNPSRTSSAHYCIDVDSIVQCVPDTVMAAQAPGKNSSYLGLEHAGYAGQTKAEWKDAYSWAMLERSAAFARAKCIQYGIPMVFVSAEDMLAGKNGITTHAEVTRAYHRSTHTDPGPNFPLNEYIQMVQKGAPMVHPPKPAGMKIGDKGKGVQFLDAMLNILIPHRITADGKGHPARLRDDSLYDNHTREAVAEFQRFLNNMLRLQRKPVRHVTGTADPYTISMIGFWVKQTLAA